ncbi:hypothetical protein WICPIJ_008690 [Wickerhamomyces pijperi]|uniref:Uncharacterized protein n=1 Tax=Wickerhamomyces pijperi TaxID=599730 RepID=A0A9P8TI53_WICPI|nr:hypothetical protein WICPIJ_008690 [Wickerhamomyces pijperi]
MEPSTSTRLDSGTNDHHHVTEGDGVSSTEVVRDGRGNQCGNQNTKDNTIVDGTQDSTAWIVHGIHPFRHGL